MSVDNSQIKTPIPISEQEWPKDVVPLVSISCITYNHEKFILNAIEGFLIQKTTFPVEILIHDDASTDNTANIIRKYEAQSPQLIKPIYQSENKYQQGIKPSQNYQIPRAKGKYYAACEGDDYWTDPLKLQKQVEFMLANPNVSVTYHEHKNVDENGELIDTRDKPLPCTMMMINDFLGMPTNIDCPNGDRLLLTYFSLKGSLKYLDDIAPSVRRHHEGGVMSMASEKEKLNRQVRTWSSIYEAFKDSKISDKLYAKKNMFTYRQMLYNWKDGHERLSNVLSYPLKVKSLKLYKQLIRNQLN